MALSEGDDTMLRLAGLFLVLHASAQELAPQAQASASRTQIEDALRVVEELKPDNDEQEQCITPKRDALRVLRDVGTRIEAELLDALADGKEQHVSLALRKLIVAQSRADQLRAEAEACLPSTSSDSTSLLTGPIISDTGETDTPEEEGEHPDPPPSSQFE